MKSAAKTDLILALTPGDPAGIGPEITWKIIRSGKFQKKGIRLLCVGAIEPFKKMRAPCVEFKKSPNGEIKFPPSKGKPFVWIIPAPTTAPKGLHLAGYQSGWSIQEATRLVLEKTASALVTGPISKDRLNQGGFEFPGHTEFLASLCGVPHVTMMLANSKLRVTLATIHVALKDVPLELNREVLRKTILQTVRGLKDYWRIRRPKVAIAALNPHAGEAGRFGNEEQEILLPEIRYLQERASREYELIGPLPADTLFALHQAAPARQRFDAVVCLYHDQGLIPVKLLDFHKTVNITLGLPIIRTSVDHGVGFDIAGKGIALPHSLEAAVELAAHLVNKSKGL